jgi:Flp pilus assembly protein TadD
MAFNWQRQHERALDEARKALDLDPTFPLAYAELGTALVLLGQAEEAIAQLGRAIELGQRHPVVLGTLGYAFATAGKRPEALDLAGQLTAAAPGRFGFALPIARILAALGEADQAFAWLTRACNERAPFVIWLRVDPTFDVLKPDPRFAQVLRDMNLPA